MRGARFSSSVLRLFSVMLLIMLVAGPFMQSASANRSPALSYQFADSFTMPLPAIPLPVATQMAPILGTLRVLVVAAEFSDINHTVSTDTIRQEYTQQVAAYYNSVSYGAVSMQVDVVGWVHLPHPQVYYGRDCTNVDDADCGGQPTSWWIARDAVPLLNNTVNFNNYDYFVFLHSGVGEETAKSSGLTDPVWSVTYLGGVYVQTPQKTLYKFNVVPELEVRGAVPIGVYTHEFGHQLGLPDLYNTVTGQTILGPWSLMDKGLWNGNPPGSSPTHMEAWSMIKLGWINGSMLAVASDGAASNYTVDPIEVASSNVHAIKIPITSQSNANQASKQYYLVEVRQHIDTDQALPSTGVLITFVDERFFQPQLKIIDGHPDIPGLADATWEPGQVFTDEQNDIAVSINAQVGNAFQITVNRLGPLPELAVSKIFTQPAAVTPNTTATIFVDITNQGTASASGVPVQVFLDNTPYASKQVTLSPGQTAEISVTWTTVAGSHIVKVIIDPYDALTELSRANNIATYTLNVGPIVIITVPLNLTTGNSTAWVKINGLQYDINGTNSISASVAAGPVTIEVDPNIYLSNGTRQSFVGWADGSTQNPRNMTITNSTSLTATYNLQYLLSVDPNGGVTTPSGWYNANNNVTVVAVSPSNITDQVTRLMFTGWSGSLTSNSTSTVVTLNEPMVLQANWKRQYFVNIVSTVGSTTGSGWYDAGSAATIAIQTPVITQNNTRQIFTGWNGTTDTASSKTIVVNSATVLQATWKTQYYLQVNSAYGAPHGSGWYDAETVAQISIEPEIDYANQTRRIFVGWSGDYFTNAPEFVLNINSPKTMNANWQTQYQLTFGVRGVPNATILELNLGNDTYDISSNNAYQGWFNSGQQVNPAINSTITEGFMQYQFSGWLNATGGAVKPPFSVNAPTQYTASYAPSLSFLSLPITGFPDESILLGFVAGLLALALLRRRRLRRQ